MNRFKTFFINSLLIAFSSLVLQIIKLTFNIYVSNKVTPEALGVFQLVMVTYMFGITLAASGINISCMKVVSEEFAFNNNYGVRKTSKKCIKISFIISLIASLIFYINAEIITKYCFEQKVGVNIVYLICIALPLISISSAISGYFVAVRRVYKTVLGQFLEQISKILAIVLLFKNIPDNSLETMCFILILGDLISEIISFVYIVIIYIFDLRKHFPIKEVTLPYMQNALYSHKSKKIVFITPKKSLNKEEYLLRILRIFFPVAFTAYIKSGISTVKQLIIPSCLEKSGQNSSEALSKYGIISGMAMPIVMFPASFLIAVSSLLIPEFSRYYVKNDYKKIRIYTDKLIIGSFIFSLILTIIYFTFGNKLGILIYHNTEVGIYIKLFALLIPFMYVDIIIDNILKGLDAQTNVMLINIIDLVVSTLFILFFVPLFGIKGYIASIFISEILNLCLSLRKILKLESEFYIKVK